MRHVVRIILGTVIGLPWIFNAQGAPQQGDLNQPRQGLVMNAVVGDRACYLTVQNCRGRVSEEYATFEVCEQKPSIIGKRVALTYKMGDLNAQSCGGEPICAQHDRVPLAIIARILADSTRTTRVNAAVSLCTSEETVVFSCGTGAKVVSV